MPFDAGSIVAKMRLNTKEFFSGLTAAEKRLGKFQVTSAGLLKGLVTGVGIEGVRRLAVQLEQAAERGAKMQEVDLAFKRVTGSAEIANSVLAGTRRVTAELANNEIKQLANRLELVGVGVDKLPQLAKIAEAIADTTGESTKQILDAIVTGTARASDRMLAAIGLNVDLAKATDAYAKSLGKTSEELSETEKQQVFLNEILARGDEIVVQLGNSIDTNSDKINRWKTSWANLFETVDKGIGTTFAKLSPWLTPKGLLIPFGGLGVRVPGGGETSTGSEDFGELGGPSVRSAGARRVAEAATAAQQKAKEAQAAAKAYFDNLLFNARSSSTTPQPRVSGGGAASLGFGGGLDFGAVADPGLSMGEGFTERFINPIADGLSVLGDSFSSLFEEIITGSGQAGRAFFSGLMSGIGGIASSVGDLFIQMGIGALAVHAFNPFAMIAAGVALKMLAGVFRGIGTKNAPSFSTATSPTRPRGDQFDEKRGGTTIIVDNFIGNKAWMQEFIRMINGVQRNTGARIEIHGAAA